MKLPTALKTLVLAVALGGLALAGPANAGDDDDVAADVFLGIVGEIASGAVERSEARRENREFDRYCRRLHRKCDYGEGWACRKYWRECDYE